MAVEMLSWLSSGVAWFVFLNIIVGAIAVMSWLGQGQGATTPSRLARTASVVVMERLRSVVNFPFQYLSGDYSVTPLHGDVSGSDYFYYPREAVAEEEVAQTSRVVAQTEAPFRPGPPLPVREILAATTSFMAPPSSPVASAGASAAIKNEEEEAEAEEESISLDEAYALAQQQARAPCSAASGADPAAAARKREAAKVADAKPRRARAEVERKAEVNARAERFIQQFREDLKLQRINSIINYTNALRRRGGITATALAPAR